MVALHKSNAFGAKQMPGKFKQQGVVGSIVNWRKEVPPKCIQILIMLFRSTGKEPNKAYLQPTDRIAG